MFEGEEISLAHWMLVKSHHQQERLAADSLIRKNFEVYLPLHMAPRREGGLVARPFFPQFMFARMTLEAERWQQVFSSRGVREIMGHSGRPTGLRDSFVEKIRAAELEGYIRIGLVPGMPKCDLSKNDAVMVDGMWPGLFQAVEGRRVKVLLKIFNSDSEDVVDISRITPRAA